MRGTIWHVVALALGASAWGAWACAGRVGGSETNASGPSSSGGGGTRPGGSGGSSGVGSGGSSSGVGSGGSSSGVGSGGSSSGAGSGGSSGAGVGVAGSDGGASAGSSPVGTPPCTPSLPCHDFPTAPIVDPAGDAVPPDVATRFGPLASSSPASGPCLVEPADGSLYPKNWVRPRIAWIPVSDETVFEVRLHSDVEASDLVVYTANTHYLLDAALWQKLTLEENGIQSEPITVTVRALVSGGGSTISSPAAFVIAPALAPGAIVYWSVATFDENATSTSLVGFHIGDEGTTLALHSSEVVPLVRAEAFDGGLKGGYESVHCIGCHTFTPDGLYLGFTAQWPWPNTFASVKAGAAGLAPPWLSQGASQNLSPDYRGLAVQAWANPPAVNQVMLGMGTFSPAHYAAGDRVYVTTLGASWSGSSPADPGAPTGVTSQLAWFNLEWDSAVSQSGGSIGTGLPVATPCDPSATASGADGGVTCLPPPAGDGGWGILARTGDSRGAGAPSWSHGFSGTDVIAYTSTSSGVRDGRMDCGVDPACGADVYVVPYNAYGAGAPGGQGGAAAPLAGASDPTFNEYYPAWSPDDALIAFNRVPAGTGMYNQPKAEIAVVPYAGGRGGAPVAITQPFPPPACSQPPAAGLQNTWPQWAPPWLDANGVATPQVDTAGNAYHWLAFSSVRGALSGGRPQIYVAGVVIHRDGTLQAYAPILAWNQNPAVNNLIPAWGNAPIPPGVASTSPLPMP